MGIVGRIGSAFIRSDPRLWAQDKAKAKMKKKDATTTMHFTTIGLIMWTREPNTIGCTARRVVLGKVAARPLKSAKVAGVPGNQAPGPTDSMHLKSGNLQIMTFKASTAIESRRAESYESPQELERPVVGFLILSHFLPMNGPTANWILKPSVSGVAVDVGPGNRLTVAF